MNLGNKQLETKIEQAVKVLCEYVPERPDRPKSLLMHSLRVGMYLYENEYTKDVVIGGLLHDILEWTDASSDFIKNEFGQHVLDIVTANIKNRDISDPVARREDYVDRCIQIGKDALIVKAADTIDSYHFYQSVGIEKEIERSVSIAQIILKKRPKKFQDPIFDKLKKLS